MSLVTLPTELILHILSFLSSQDIGRMSRICRCIYRLCSKERLWKALLARDYPRYYLNVDIQYRSSYKCLSLIRSFRVWDGAKYPSFVEDIHIPSIIGNSNNGFYSVGQMNFIYPIPPLPLRDNSEHIVVYPDMFINMHNNLFIVIYDPRPQAYGKIPRVTCKAPVLSNISETKVCYLIIYLEQFLTDVKEAGYLFADTRYSTCPISRTEIERYPDLWLM